MIYLLLIASFALNVVLVWYSKKMVNDLSDLSLEVEEVVADLNIYHKHVEQVYNLQTFYGDETLKALLSHSRAVSERVNNFTTLFSNLEDEELTEAQEDEMGDINEETNEEQIPQEKKHVFYAGTRRRNN
jgi:hypothetical protein